MTMNKKAFSAERGNRLKRGSVSVIYTVVFIALVIALNLVVSSIAGSISLTIDLTAEAFISIGETSRNVLGDLEKNGDLQATIYLLADRDAYDNVADSTRESMRGLNPLALVRDLCEEYARTYSGITVEYKNLERDPEWAAEYNVRANTTLTTNNIVVEGTKHEEGKNHARVLTLDAFFTVDSETKQYIGFNGELRLTTALLQSCISEPQVVTFTTGHGEPSGAVTPLAALLGNNGFEVIETDLSSENIDERTRILIVNDPQTDFTESEVEKLMDYVGAYNSLVVLVDDSTPALPNLQDYLLEEWGMNYRPYHQISSPLNFNNNPLNLSAQYVTDAAEENRSAGYEIVKNLSGKTIMPNSVELYGAPVKTKDRYTLETVLRSSSDSTSAYAVDGTEETGAFPLMLLSSQANFVDLDDANSTNQVLKYQYVMLAGSTDFARTGSIDSASYLNSAIMLSAVRLMGVERYSLNIDYKPINDVALTIETDTAFRLAIIICAVLPAAITIAGLVVFIRRRHL